MLQHIQNNVPEQIKPFRSKQPPHAENRCQHVMKVVARWSFSPSTRFSEIPFAQSGKLRNERPLRGELYRVRLLQHGASSPGTEGSSYDSAGFQGVSRSNSLGARRVQERPQNMPRGQNPHQKRVWVWGEQGSQYWVFKVWIFARRLCWRSTAAACYLQRGANMLMTAWDHANREPLSISTQVCWPSQHFLNR